ncbi:MAG TPA: hypothetical protein VGG97_13540 [Bryobacteraceae bacterium]|jgi:hypothetical protein
MQHRRDFCRGLAVLSALADIHQIQADSPGTAAAAWDAAGQRWRREQVYGLHQRLVGPLFDDRGKWIGRSTEPGGRERLWNCLSFLRGAATREKANAIIRSTFAERSRFNEFSHFEFVTSIQLLLRDKDELTKETRDLLTGLLSQALARRSEICFLGYNDNFPAMENEVSTLGGEFLDNQEAIKQGREGMERLLELLHRRGLLSEYTSSTYSPVTMLCYSDIAEYSKDAASRQMALEIERRVWKDIAAHFHGPTNILAGPHSRAYAVDTVGHLHQVHMMLYQAFGNRLWMTPPQFMFPPIPGQVIHHDGDVPFMQVSNVWIAAGTYHPSAEIAHLCFDKTYPFRVSATSEFGCAPQNVLIRNTANGKPKKTEEVIEYPSGELVATTYMTGNFAVGSATEQFLDGNQTDTFFVNFQRSAHPNSLHDISTIFCRYTVDDFGPGKPWTDPRNPGVEVTRSLFGESGRTHPLQKDGTVLVPYQSKGEFIGEFKGLRLTIAVPVFYRPVHRILFGARVVKPPFQSQTADTVWLDDGFLFACFWPLTITNHGREAAVRIEEADGYLSIHLINYEGKYRSFDRHGLLHTLNGFAAEIGGPADHGSFEQFQQKVSGAEISDQVSADQRIVSYRRKGVALAMSYSLTNDRLKYTLVDEKLPAREMFRIT